MLLNKERSKLKIFFALLFSISLSAFAQEVNESKTTLPNESSSGVVAPARVKFDLSAYYYNFEGTRQQRDGLYTFGDTTLRMDLLTMTYQVNPAWTLMMIGQRYENYVVTKTDAATFIDRTSGFGDVILSGLTPLVANAEVMVLGDIGVSLPTGSINNRVAGYADFNYPYNMQMGSGTYDIVAGISPMAFFKTGTLSSRLSSAIRTGRNQNEYTLGNLYRLDASYDFKTGTGFTPRFVGYYKYKDSVSGEDKFRPRDAFTEFYFHSQINWDVSVALKYQAQIPGTQIAIGGEFGVPVAQDSQNYDHVVVSTEYYGNLSLKGEF